MACGMRGHLDLIVYTDSLVCCGISMRRGAGRSNNSEVNTPDTTKGWQWQPQSGEGVWEHQCGRYDI
eukprot:2549327-Amphidinium_carterae.2